MLVAGWRARHCDTWRARRLIDKLSRAAMSRRTQIGALSFLLTLVWAVALCAAFVVGKIGQHPSLSVGLATSGAFCATARGLLFTLSCFPGMAEGYIPDAL